MNHNYDFFLSTVQHDGRIVGAVRQLPGGDGRNVSTGRGEHTDAPIAAALQSQLEPEQPDVGVPDGQRFFLKLTNSSSMCKLLVVLLVSFAFPVLLL